MNGKEYQKPIIIIIGIAVEDIVLASGKYDQGEPDMNGERW